MNTNDASDANDSGDEELQRKYAPTLKRLVEPAQDAAPAKVPLIDENKARDLGTYYSQSLHQPTTYASGNITITAREPKAEVAKQVDEGPKAFSVEINGKQLIAAPAIAALREPSLEDITREHMMWMHGRFVGAEVPNSNNALWSSGDLEMAQGTVLNGPLNWLHQAKHVIGAIAKADFVGKAESAAGQTVQPHITATAGVWKWLYPDEAWVIENASNNHALWYSMECISKEVVCSGENGCGNATTYGDYMAGAACQHVQERASVRRFKDPTFLGGAVIVPPTRPGWSQADATVMKTAESLAEAAYDQSGRPDIPATIWEQMMAQIVLSAN